MSETETPESVQGETVETAAPATQAAEAEATAPAGETNNDATANAADAAPAESAPEAAAAPEGEAAATGEEAGKKKRKRRRRKKKSGEGEGGDRKAQVFTRFFDGQPSRQHAFRSGEVVAGRVSQCDKGAIVVDLFGKATAIADVDEPREVPELPDAPVAAKEAKAEGEAAAPEATEAPEAPAGEATEAPAAEATEAPAAEAAEAPAAAAVEAPAAEATEAPAAEAAEAPVAEATEAPVEAKEIDLNPTKLDVLEPVEVGSIYRGRVGAVSESGHVAIVNRIIDRGAAKARVAHAREQRHRLSGVVFGFNRGGFDVLVEGIRAFCPASGMSLEGIADPNAFLGQRLEFSVPQSKGGKSIIVSRRSILERDLRKASRERMKELKVGERLDGKVTDIRDYGVIVDIGGGVDGLVHQSEVSWGRGIRPADAVKKGDAVKVEVLKVQPATRKDRFGRLSLSIRRCLPDPWEANPEAIEVGVPRKGKVVRTTDFGAFIELAEGIEGLLHISELGGGKEIKHASQVLNDGDELDIIIERLDRGQRRISLSRLSEADLSAIAAGEWDPKLAPRSLKPGAHIKVVVDRVERHGIFVQVRGVLGKKGRGYIPGRELPMSGDNRKTYAQGTELEVKIIGTDRDGQLKCSVKGVQMDEERKAVREYRKEAAAQGFGTFGDLLKQKLGGKE